jgi:hypothetical protein
VVAYAIAPSAFGAPVSASPYVWGAGGIWSASARGSRAGCTSGHGVCGVGRLSPRSMVATATFMLTGAVTVFAVRWLGVA